MESVKYILKKVLQLPLALACIPYFIRLHSFFKILCEKEYFSIRMSQIKCKKLKKKHRSHIYSETSTYRRHYVCAIREFVQKIFRICRHIHNTFHATSCANTLRVYITNMCAGSTILNPFHALLRSEDVVDKYFASNNHIQLHRLNFKDILSNIIQIRSLMALRQIINGVGKKSMACKDRPTIPSFLFCVWMELIFLNEVFRFLCGEDFRNLAINITNWNNENLI